MCSCIRFYIKGINHKSQRQSHCDFTNINKGRKAKQHPIPPQQGQTSQCQNNEDDFIG